MQRLVIQRALIDFVRAGRFYEVTYETGTGKPNLYDPQTAPNCAPDSVRCNEMSEAFMVDKDYGQDLILKPTQWTFAVFVSWNNKEVDLTAFEEACMRTRPQLVKTDNYREVEMFLVRKDVTHPVEQGATTGTEVKYLFQAELGRA